MACLIQLLAPSIQDTVPQSQAQPGQSYLNEQSRAKSNIYRLFNNFYCPVIRFADQQTSNFLICFLVPFLQHFELLFQFQLSKSDQLTKIRFKLRREGRISYVGFNQAIKSFCKTMASLNLCKSKSRFAFVVDLKSGQIGGRAAYKATKLNNRTLLIQIKSLVAQVQNIAQDFIARFLYNYSSYGLKFMKEYASRQTHQLYFSKQGHLRSFMQLKQLLPFINVDIQKDVNMIPNKDNSILPTLKTSQETLALSFSQYKKLERQNILYAFCSSSESDQSINRFLNNGTLKLELAFPAPPKNVANQNLQNIKKINVISSQSQRETVLKEGMKVRVGIVPIKFKQIPLRGPENAEAKVKEQQLIVKQPAKKIDFSKGLMTVKYQKEIVQVLNSEYCLYIPTYYQATQQNVPFKDFLIMEFISSYTFHEVAQIKKYFLGLNSKLKLLMHLSNALRFLDKQQVVHIDLSPNNILVVDDLFIKLIDFGQSYCQKITYKYASQKAAKNDTGFKYRPCKTYPYSSPEAYCRSSNFTSHQDAYSFGLIAFRLLFGHHLLNCSQKTLEKLYKSKEYTDRMFFVPEITSEYANNDSLCILAYLIFKMLDVDQKTRPLISWVHIIIKRMFILANR